MQTEVESGQDPDHVRFQVPRETQLHYGEDGNAVAIALMDKSESLFGQLTAMARRRRFGTY